MKLFTVEHHHFHHLDRPLAEALAKIGSSLGGIESGMETIMIDTSKLLAAVARQKTDDDSLRALIAANTKAMGVVSGQLTDAIATIASLKSQLTAAQAGGDPGALAALQGQVTDLQGQITGAQADLDKATADLSVDSDKSEAALAANVPPADPAAPAAPPASPAPAAPPASPEPTVPADPTASSVQPLPGTAPPDASAAPASPAPANPS